MGCSINAGHQQKAGKLLKVGSKKCVVCLLGLLFLYKLLSIIASFIKRKRERKLDNRKFASLAV